MKDSSTEQSSATGESDKKGKQRGSAKAVIEKETMLGNPAYLAGVMSCIERRCKILGLDAPTKIAPTAPDGKTALPIIVMKQTDLDALMP